MLISLVIKEIKYQLKSITFYLFLAVITLFYVSQFLPSLTDFKKPVPGQSYYGSAPTTNKEDEIKAVYKQLNLNLNVGSVLRYGKFINKMIVLSDSDKENISKAIKAISPNGEQDGKLNIVVSYEEYLNIVRHLDKQLGGSTDFGDEHRSMLSKRPMTYEEALDRYNKTINIDKFSNASARLFSDYMGITAGLFTVFLSAFILTRDKRTKAYEVIYSRSVSSATYILSKYIGICICVFLGYLMLASYSTFITIKISSLNNYPIDYLSYYKYTFIWILPTVCFSNALAMLLSAIFNNGIVAIILQFVIWINSLLPLIGDYSLLKPIIRFNSLGRYDEYISYAKAIEINRIFYLILCLVMVSINILVHSMKRGANDGSLKKLFKLHKIQH
jgi:ABC-type transport system involved in multi-copper enzyme maturation permease subunit